MAERTISTLTPDAAARLLPAVSASVIRQLARTGELRNVTRIAGRWVLLDGALDELARLRPNGDRDAKS